MSNTTNTTNTKATNRQKRTQTHDRHKRFVKWIIETFPHIKSSNDSRHVLDIASGKGETAARLAMCHQVKVMMIEPRIANVEQTYKSKVLSKLPIKWQKSMGAHLISNPDFIHDELSNLVSQIHMCFTDETVANNIYLQDALTNASLLIGLHADNATEPIIDAALQYKIPFIVVPCCVFGNSFPNRRLNGKHVMEYEEFIQYLLQKDCRFKREILPFPGRNIAIWWDGKD